MKVVKHNTGFFQYESFRMLARLLSVIVLLGLLSIPARVLARCELQRFGELLVTMQNMQPLVKGTINGIPAVFLADSGSFFNFLKQPRAKKFHLRLRNNGQLMVLRGVNGDFSNRVGTAKTFSLDGLENGKAFHRVDFIVGGYSSGEPYDGMIGQNILSKAETEYDLANGVIRLFKSRGCNFANLAYWAGNTPVTMMRLHRFSEYDTSVVADAALNSKNIQVAFDTGTPYSTLSLTAARRIGLSLQDKGVKSGGVLGSATFVPRRLESWVAHFDSLNLNGEIIKNAHLHIIDMRRLPFDMLLGSDFFLSHRIMVARSQGQIYFTYNGGPVFNYTETGGKVRHAQVAGDKSVERTNANSMKRRAMALANRHEYKAALAAFDHVIQLAPRDPDNYLQRALVYGAYKKPKLELIDLNQALKINPGLEKALLARGSVYLWQNNDAAAEADFDAAIKSAKPDSTVQLEIGSRYLYRNEFNEAVAHFTAWIDANPTGQQLPFALTHRCEARAYANRKLKSALEDCQLALHKVRGDSDMLANMALVYLRLGDYDKAIYYYKKSIELQPKSDWSLYGLGIAQERQGSRAEGEKSIKAALAIDPEVAHAYQSIGIKP